jgi:F-type H+-transporting ATPase subunit b
MKREIVDVSAQLTGKLLQREINEEDHKKLIDSFLSDLGD